jgi:hypothetical protein
MVNRTVVKKKEELSMEEYFNKYVYKNRESFYNFFIHSLLSPYIPKCKKGGLKKKHGQ